MTSAWRACLVLAVPLLIGACGKKEARAPVGTDDGRAALAKRKAAAVTNPVSGYMVASVGERTLGPFFARRGSGPAAAGLVAAR